MVCYHPLKGFLIGKTANGKDDYKIVSYQTDHIEFYNNTWKCASCDLVSSFSERVVRDFIEIPCGQCIGCRLDYSRQWADRCLVEMKDHSSNYFLTLTYDDAHLPINEYLDKETGAVEPIATLVKRDFQLFMKRLRKNYKYDNKLRFFAAGEYGEHTARPHYHAIIFGLILDDLIFYKRLGDFNYYTSPFLDGVWKNGYVVVASANWATCAYVARYIVKKQKGETKSIYSDFNFEPEFSLMSRKPGIGKDFFDKNYQRFIEEDKIFISTPEGSKDLKLNKYYRRLLDGVDPEESIVVKERLARAARNIHYHKQLKSSQSYLDLLSSEELNKLDKVKILKRGDF